MKNYNLIPLLFIIISLCSSSCTKNTLNEDRSPLLIKIDAVHRQMMKQGNISMKEEEAIRALAALLPKETIEDPRGNSNFISYNEIEIKPIYSGCENLNIEEQHQCFLNKLDVFIKSEFNNEVIESLNLSGKQEIDIFIKIDKYGYPTAFKVRGTLVELQAESGRTLNKIPRFIPGLKDGQNIDVIFPDFDTPYTIVLNQ